jgi:predicted metalloprotease with PDZ domain
MMTFIGADRCRILGRDVFLLPDAVAADGIVIDVAMKPGRRLSASSPCARARVIVPDLAELPFAMLASGDYRCYARNIGGSEIVLAIADSWLFGDTEFFDIVCSIVSREIAIFGSAPRARYLFICDRNPVLGKDRFDYYGIHYGGSMLLLLDGRLDRSELMDTPMAIIAHEFFHNWNGDAMAPSSDAFLWFTEGVTNYFSYHVLREARVITDQQYESRRRAVFERFAANPLRSTVSIGEAGNSDMRDKDMVNLLYDGGYLAAEALQARLRAESGGTVTLLDVLKRMYDNVQGGGSVDESSFLAAARELAGCDLTAHVHRLVHIPDPKILASSASPLE